MRITKNVSNLIYRALCVMLDRVYVDDYARLKELDLADINTFKTKDIKDLVALIEDYKIQLVRRAYLAEKYRAALVKALEKAKKKAM